MKKSLWMAAFVAAALSSCTQNEEIGNAVDSNNGAIKFSTYVGQNTRAAITDLPALKGEGAGFYVLAYSTGKDGWDVEAETDPTLNFMLNDQVSWDETAETPVWTYDNIKYWPNVVDGVADNYGKVSFFAYAPVEITDVLAAAPATGAGFPTLTYTCPTDPTAQKDVVTAQALDQKKNSNSGKVDLVFNHILSKIGFSAKLDADYDNATITVTGLKVLYDASMDKTNTYRMDKETWGTATEDDKFTAGDKGTVLTGASKTLTWDADDDVADVIPLLNGTAATSTNFLMMLPQAVGDKLFKVELTYTVLDIERQKTITNVITVPLPAIEWVKGKQYTYVLKVSETAVVFDGITVSEWVNYDSDGGNTGNVEV